MDISLSRAVRYCSLTHSFTHLLIHSLTPSSPLFFSLEARGRRRHRRSEKEVNARESVPLGKRIGAGANGKEREVER